MCSINDEDLDTLPELDMIRKQLTSICKKCGGEATVVLRKKDEYCVRCFTLAANHKFRASLGKNKTIRANQRVLVAISGGLASTVLLHFVHNGIREDSHKKLRVDPVCIYINGVGESDHLTHSQFVLEQCKQYDLPVYVAHLSSALDVHAVLADVNTAPTPNKDLDDQFHSLVKCVASETSRIDLIVKLRRSLLIRCARQLKCDYILTGEISTTLASTMLANLALGRGAQIQNDIGFCDSRDAVKILKPMKDLTYEELKYIAELKTLPYHDKVIVGSKDSIQSTILKFVVNLHENFPATISTICKTGDKMGDAHGATQDAELDCLICQSTRDTENMNSSALQATEFSRLVSSRGPHHVPAAADASTDNGTQPCVGCSCSQQHLSCRDLDLFLCYGCRLIFREISDFENLPISLKNAVKSRMVMAKLRSEINDFLI